MEAAELELLFPFQSTPLMRGETPADLTFFVLTPISIHSPHARGDPQALAIFDSIQAFQSTPLMRGETAADERQAHPLMISIHSPHARGDRRFPA